MVAMHVSTVSPEVTRRGILDMQVCVPEGWQDDEIISFAEMSNPCGTTNGWQIRKSGCTERVACSVRVGFVHVMLDA